VHTSGDTFFDNKPLTLEEQDNAGFFARPWEGEEKRASRRRGKKS